MARTKPLSRKGCDMLADVVHESLEIAEYCYHPSFSRPSLSLSLSLFRINPLAAYLLPTPPLAPPYPTLGHLFRTRATVSIQPDNQRNYKTERNRGNLSQLSRIHQNRACSLETVFLSFFLSRYTRMECVRVVCSSWRVLGTGEGRGSSVLSRRKKCGVETAR